MESNGRAKCMCVFGAHALIATTKIIFGKSVNLRSISRPCCYTVGSFRPYPRTQVHGSRAPTRKEEQREREEPPALFWALLEKETDHG